MNAKDRWKEDVKRYGRVRFNPTLLAIFVYRMGQLCEESCSGLTLVVCRKIYWVVHHVVSGLLGIEIPKDAQIGGGLRIEHAGGIVVHPDVVIGEGATLRHGVTIGERSVGGGVPRIGKNVSFGANAMVLGPIHVGDGAQIGAMALVLEDVPAGGVAKGNKATISARLEC